MPARRPLPTLLSQVPIAFTIEHDNEAEQRVAASGKATGFLVSLVMWANFMRLVDDDGLRVGDTPDRAGVPGTPVTSGWIHSTLSGMTRWGYVVVARDSADARPKPPRADWIVRATPRGKRAEEVWRPLAAEIEQRWRARFGDARVDALCGVLVEMVNRAHVVLPRYLPVAGYGGGMTTGVPHLTAGKAIEIQPERADALDLSALLSQVLMLFAVEFERDSRVSLAMSANALRVLSDDAQRVRELQLLTGVSKEAIGVSLGFLERRGYAVVEPDPVADRGKVVRVTPKGRKVRDVANRVADAVEARWHASYADDIDRLRAALDALLDHPKFSEGLVPPPGGWRASKPYAAQSAAFIADPRDALPHHPMVTHRGGWPDGSRRSR